MYKVDIKNHENAKTLEALYHKMLENTSVTPITRAHSDLANFLDQNFTGELKQNLSKKTNNLEMTAFFTGAELILNLLPQIKLI